MSAATASHPVSTGTWKIDTSTRTSASPSSTWSSRRSAASFDDYDGVAERRRGRRRRASRAPSTSTRSSSRTRTSPGTSNRLSSSTASATRRSASSPSARRDRRRRRARGRGRADDQGPHPPRHRARQHHRPARRHRRQRQARRRARGRHRPPRVRPRVERAAAQGRLRARERRQAPGLARAREGGVEHAHPRTVRQPAPRLPQHAPVERDARAAAVRGGARRVRPAGEIPPYSEDDEHPTPAAVAALKAAIADADAVLVATPEYNGSIPGVLKNALDWVSRRSPRHRCAASPPP